MNDAVEFKVTGYNGYCLEKVLSDKMMVCVSYTELGKPKLYIKKTGQERYHIVQITGEMVKDLINKD
jgi:hypothetical protein